MKSVLKEMRRGKKNSKWDELLHHVDCYRSWLSQCWPIDPFHQFPNTSPDGPSCENDASDEQMEEEKMQEMHSLFIVTSSQMW